MAGQPVKFMRSMREWYEEVRLLNKKLSRTGVLGFRGPAGGIGSPCEECGVSTWVELAGGPSNDAYHPNIDRIPCSAWLGSKHLPDEDLANENVDIVHDLREGIPLHDNHATRLKMIDVFNFFSQEEAQRLMSEVLRVLKPGGSFFIRTVDLMWAAEQIGEQGLSQKWLEVIYGSPGSSGLIGYHRWGYTFDTLKEVLEQRGFVNVTHHGFYNYHEMKLEAWKPNTTHKYEFQLPYIV